MWVRSSQEGEFREPGYYMQKGGWRDYFLANPLFAVTYDIQKISTVKGELLGDFVYQLSGFPIL